MVNIISFEDTHYYPPPYPGLEELVCFPDGEIKRRTIPNSTVWVFSQSGHSYIPEILGNDVGCGMAAFIISEVDPVKSADIVADFLRGKGILGRGNHFVDICSGLDTLYHHMKHHYLLVIHTDGKHLNEPVPGTIEAAQAREKMASGWREDLGYTLAGLIGAQCQLAGNWTHNSVEANGHIIYRKGAVRVTPEKVHMLPAHLGAKILFYTVDGQNLPPYASFPHATGRAGPRGDLKVDEAVAQEVRDQVYVPICISNGSLRTEHPTGYNDFSKIMERLGREKLFTVIGEATILSYIGKV